MKKLDLNGFGVQEMNVEETINQNGGSMAGPSASYYMTSDQMNAVGGALRTAAGAVVGFINGFLGF